MAVSVSAKVSRRELLRKGLAGSALGVAGLSSAALTTIPAQANGGVSGPESTQVGEIYELQAAFHRAKTTQDLDLMMSLWGQDATFNNRSTGIVYHGLTKSSRSARDQVPSRTIDSR
jgi:hypothetical protein